MWRFPPLVNVSTIRAKSMAQLLHVHAGLGFHVAVNSEKIRGNAEIGGWIHRTAAM
jgi:hypothetical protein